MVAIAYTPNKDNLSGKAKKVNISVTKFTDSWFIELVTVTTKSHYENYNSMQIEPESLQPVLTCIVLGILQTGCKVFIESHYLNNKEVIEWLSEYARIIGVDVTDYDRESMRESIRKNESVMPYAKEELI